MSRARVTITQPIHTAEVNHLVIAGLDVKDLRSEQPLTSDQLRSAGHEATAIICQITDEMDDAVLRIPAAAGGSSRTRWALTSLGQRCASSEWDG